MPSLRTPSVASAAQGAPEAYVRNSGEVGQSRVVPQFEMSNIRHQTLRVTPAMVAGVDERLWSIEDIASLIPSGKQS